MTVSNNKKRAKASAGGHGMGFIFPFLQHRESGLWRLLGQGHFANLDLIGRVVKKSETIRSKFLYDSLGYVVTKR